MKNHACLIAGPLNLDDLNDAPDTLGGSGFYAAAAAAPFALSQLWCRAGNLNNQMKNVISARHVDDGGVDYEGETNRWSRSTGLIEHGDVLGEFTPTSANDLTCALAIDLSGQDMERAFTALDELGDQVGRTLIVAPRLSHCLAEAPLLNRCCERAGILILNLSHALALCQSDDPIQATRQLQTMGAKTVILPSGSLGGIAAYQQKIWTWGAYPVEVKEPTGITSSFAGALAGSIAESGKCDWRSLKRGLAQASAVASLCAQGIGPKKLLGSNRSDYTDRFNRLRRNGKY